MGRARRRGGETLGDTPLIAAALAELALADSSWARPSGPRRTARAAAALVDSLSDDELAGHLEAAAWLAGAELYLDRYAEGEAHASRALALARATGQGELFLVLVADPGRAPGASGASWPRRPSCSTAESRRRGCWATRRRWCGTCSAARPPRCAAATSTLALATAQESVDLSRRRRQRLPFRRGGRGSRRGPARDGRSRTRPSSCSSSQPAARSWCSSPAAREPATSRC